MHVAYDGSPDMKPSRSDAAESASRPKTWEVQHRDAVGRCTVRANKCICVVIYIYTYLYMYVNLYSMGVCKK